MPQFQNGKTYKLGSSAPPVEPLPDNDQLPDGLISIPDGDYDHTGLVPLDENGKPYNNVDLRNPNPPAKFDPSKYKAPIDVPDNSIWQNTKQALTEPLWTGPSKLASNISEKLNNKGYGVAGAGIQALGDLASGFTSPLNIGMTLATEGGNLLAKAGGRAAATTLEEGGTPLTEAAANGIKQKSLFDAANAARNTGRALAVPGILEGGKELTSDDPWSTKLNAIPQMLLGGLALHSGPHLNEIAENLSRPVEGPELSPSSVKDNLSTESNLNPNQPSLFDQPESPSKVNQQDDSNLESVPYKFQNPESRNEFQPEVKESNYFEGTPPNAKAIVDSLPNKSNGLKESPFPKVDDKVLDELIRNKQVDYANPHLEDVPLNNLLGTQDTVDPNIVKNYTEQGDRARLDEVPEANKGRMDDEAPVVIKVGDQNVLAGGHHRATADLANGKDSMQAVVYDTNIPPELLNRFKTSLENDRARQQGADIPYNIPEVDQPVNEEGDIFPQEMRANKNPNNIAVGGAPPRLVKMIGGNLYSKDRPLIATKELLQNAIDEHKIAGTDRPIRVAFVREDTNPETGEPSQSIHIQDSGRGLTKNQLETVFTNVGESGKGKEKNASGGFGLAKAAPMLGGQYARFTSIVKEGNKTIKYSFEGNPKQLQDQDFGVALKKETVPNNTPTGLRAQVYYDKDAYFGPASQQVENMGKKSLYNKSPLQFADVYGKVQPKEMENYLNGESSSAKIPGSDDYNHLTANSEMHRGSEAPALQDKIELPGADLYIHYDDPTGQKEQIYNLDILNKGLYQFGQEGHYSNKGALRDVPGNIKVNVVPRVEEDETGYPFTMNREQLDNKVQSAIKDWIDKNIISGARQKQIQSLRDMYNGMNLISSEGNRPTVFYDPNNILTPAERDSFVDSPFIHKFSLAVDNIIQSVLETIGQPKWTDRLKQTGITLEPGIHGVHIPNPDETNASTILINPFNFLRNNDDPMNAVRENLATILHEAGHLGNHSNTKNIASHPIDWSAVDTSDPNIGHFFQKYMNEVAHAENVGDAGHGLEFLRNLAEIYSKGGTDLWNRGLEELHGAITNESGSGYANEIPELLRLYTEREGRAGTEKDILSGTGQQSEVTPPAQNSNERNVGSGRKRPVRPVNIGKKLTSEFNKRITPENAKVQDTEQTSKLEDPKDINNIKQSVPQSQIPQRIANISDHLEQAKSKVTNDERENLVQQAQNFMRTLLTSYNLHAPGRQGLPLIWHPAWWKAWGPMMKSLGSEGAYKTTMQSIQNDPSGLFIPQEELKGRSFANKAGLDLTDLLSNREEMLKSRAAEMIPGVRPSVRAYTAYMNKLRADTFKSLVKAASAENNLPEAKQIADFVNVATGRGNLGPFEGSAKAMANLFFSPRLMASHIQMYSRTFNPKYYASVPPAVRQAQLKSALSVAGTGILIGQLGKLAGGEVNSDPTDSDFGKLKFGNTRIDPFASHQQYLVAAAKLLMGESTSSVTGKTTDLTRGKFGQPTRADVAERFLTNKLAPVPSFVWAWMQNKEFDGTPFDAKSALVNRVAPIVGQDIYDIWKNDPDVVPGWIATGSSMLGAGVHTYGR